MLIRHAPNSNFGLAATTIAIEEIRSNENVFIYFDASFAILFERKNIELKRRRPSIVSCKHRQKHH